MATTYKLEGGKTFKITSLGGSFETKGLAILTPAEVEIDGKTVPATLLTYKGEPSAALSIHETQGVPLQFQVETQGVLSQANHLALAQGGRRSRTRSRRRKLSKRV